MKLARTLAVLSLLTVLVLLSGSGSQGQPKEPPTKDVPKPTAKGLPRHWDKLGLSDEQQKEIIRLNTEAKDKVAKLKEEVEKLQKEIGRIESESAKKRVAVLTDEQKKKLVELVAEPDNTKAKEK